jgi:hypothetical protein
MARKISNTDRNTNWNGNVAADVRRRTEIEDFALRLLTSAATRPH